MEDGDVLALQDFDADEDESFRVRTERQTQLHAPPRSIAPLSAVEDEDDLLFPRKQVGRAAHTPASSVSAAAAAPAVPFVPGLPLPPPAKYASGHHPRALTPPEDSSRSSGDSIPSLLSELPELPSLYVAASGASSVSGSTPRSGGAVPRGPSPKPPSFMGSVNALFGRSETMPGVPECALMHCKAESHFGGVANDPRSCKIFGKAMVWLTPTDLVVKSVSGGSFTWKCVPPPPPPLAMRSLAHLCASRVLAGSIG